MKLASYLRGLGIGMAATAVILHFSGGAVDSGDKTGGQETVVSSESGNKRLSEVATGTPTPVDEGPFAGMIPAPDDEADVPDDMIALLPGVSENETGEEPAEPTESEDTEVTVTPTTEPTATRVPTATQVPTATHAVEPTATKAIEPTATKVPTPTTAPTATPTPTKAPTPTPVPVTTPTPASSSGGQVSLNTEEKEVVVVSGDDSYSVSRKMADAGIIPSAAEFDKYMCANKYDRHIATGIHKIPAGCSYQRICEILTKAR